MATLIFITFSTLKNTVARGHLSCSLQSEVTLPNYRLNAISMESQMLHPAHA